MPLEMIQKRFIDEINLRGYDDKYIDKNEEREILQIAIHQGISVDVARTALAEVSAKQGYVLESDLLRMVNGECQSAAANNGKIDRMRFETILQTLRNAAQGRRADAELKKLVVLGIEDNGLKIQSGWFFNWYGAIKREIGMK